MIMRVLENSHPVQLEPVVGGDWSAEQRLVVLSNMKRGFCVTLRMATAEVEAWRLQTEQTGGITLSPVSTASSAVTIGRGIAAAVPNAIRRMMIAATEAAAPKPEPDSTPSAAAPSASPSPPASEAAQP